MPALETIDRYQAAVLWPFLRLDDHGETIIDQPEEVNVRWVWKQSQMLNDKGQPVAVNATVITDDDIPLGSIMWEGSLEDYYAVGSAGDADWLMEVSSIGKAPDIKGRDYQFKYGLTFYRNERPRIDGEPLPADEG